MSQQYYMYTKVPASEFSTEKMGSGAVHNDANLHVQSLASTALISDNYDALQHQRTNDIKNEVRNDAGDPMVYTISNVTFSSFAKEVEAVAKLNDSGMRRAAEVSTQGMITHGHDAVIGADYLFASADLGSNVMVAVDSQMQVRRPALQELRDAISQTPGRNMPNMSDSKTKESLQACYVKDVRKCDMLNYAFDKMAERGVDTAAQAMPFQEYYEKHLIKLGQQYPDWGQAQRQVEAAIATALHWQLHECGSDLRQQGVFSNIAGHYAAQREQAVIIDTNVKDQALTFATQAVSDHLRQNGQFINNQAAQVFRHRVLTQVIGQVNMEGFSQSMVQGVIKNVARQFEKDVRESGDHKAGFCFANIGDQAEKEETNMERNGADEQVRA